MIRKKSQPEYIGGQAFHVGDCHLWAEIQYLESPTDYREYILPDRSQENRVCETGLLMLSDMTQFPWANGRKFIRKFLQLWHR
jgi:hypothetical protein